MSHSTRVVHHRPLPTAARFASRLGALAVVVTAAACTTKSDTARQDTAAPATVSAAPAAGDTSHLGAGTSAGMSGGMTAMGGMTGNPDQDFLRMMSDHHKGLIAMAHPTMEGKGSTAAVKADARKLDKTQDAEIDTMVTMLEKNFKDPYGPKVTPDNQAMADSLAQQSGAPYDRTFYQDVIAHHRQAIGMIDQYLPKLTRPDLKAMATRMKADQEREIKEYQQKLAAR